MTALVNRIRAYLGSGANQIALSGAVRGTLSTAVPLIALQAAGLGTAGLIAAIGGLQTSMSDTGGAYRRRLTVMLLNTLLAPIGLFIGSQVREVWWLAALIMFWVASVGGFARSFGQTGTSLGLNFGIVFLVGMLHPTPALEGLREAAFYASGGVWTIVVALIFWKLRPYRRLIQEVAGCLIACADLVALIADRGVERPRPGRRERAIARRHHAVRTAIEQASAALGDVRSGIAGKSPVIEQLLVFIRAASRISAAMLSLHHAAATGQQPLEKPVARSISDTLMQLERVCRALYATLLAGHGEIRTDDLRRSLAALEALQRQSPAMALEPALAALRQAQRHVQAAIEALSQLHGLHYRLPGLLPPLRANAARINLAAVRAQLTLNAIPFRHGLRVGVAAATGTAIFTYFKLPHGIWIPMTSLVVMQPDFGATLERAVGRGGGTIVGAFFASILIFVLHRTTTLDVAIVVLTFLTFLLIRRHYGIGIVFLTPLIILLLDVFAPGDWRNIGYRTLDTVLGAVLALVAGYALWPSWQRLQLPDYLARAVTANRDYLHAVLAAAASGDTQASAVIQLRRRAEIETGNAEAAFQRMLAEPGNRRRSISNVLVLTTYLRRLCQHTTALAIQLDGSPAPEVKLDELTASLDDLLTHIARALADGHGTTPATAAVSAEIHRRVHDAQPAETAAGHPLLPLLLDRIVSDINSLHAEAAL
ncbi:MAG TPA: FUSC family protein [Burkholderiales bacterium]|nr:FUSC family protein [Burkholderiales bacterium]